MVVGGALELYFVFFKIALFGFGGGYAMVSLIQRELANHGWMSAAEFADIIAISEMTPGAIAINSATFVGFKVSSLTGAIAATLGVLTPSFLLVLLLMRFLQKSQGSPYVINVLSYLRPIVVALVFGAGLVLARTCFKDLIGGIIGLGIFVLVEKTKIDPIAAILLSGLSGIILYA